LTLRLVFIHKKKIYGYYEKNTNDEKEYIICYAEENDNIIIRHYNKLQDVYSQLGSSNERIYYFPIKQPIILIIFYNYYRLIKLKIYYKELYKEINEHENIIKYFENIDFLLGK
jgi:hypothetical protein